MTPPYTPGSGEQGYPRTAPASATPARRVLAAVSLLASAAVAVAPFLPWVWVSQKAFLLIPAQSRSWTAMDELPETSSAPGYLALAAGVIGLALALAALATGRKPLGLAALAPGVLGAAACLLFVREVQSYQDQVQSDLIAQLAQAVLDIRGGLAAGWFLALGGSVVLLACGAGHLLRKV
ncbi:hypothetical protein [Actinocorallia populi]|uniref:hypothetical protein n=1 Tax=Actinocorallia populi TaxID=2079200 RepID=UPI00130037D4|nr:hypothetical protein [Actinocorallia populi]